MEIFQNEENKPGPKGKVQEDPELKIGDRVKIKKASKCSARIVLKIDPESIYTIATVKPDYLKSCFLEEEYCKNICQHFKECNEANDEVYANLIVQQIVTLLEAPAEEIGSCWFDKV